MVAQALQAAQLIREGERRVMEVREKMEAIGQRVESALSRVVHSDSQLGMLKAKMHVSTEAKGTCTQSDMFDHQHSGGSYRKTSPPVQEPVVESWTSSRSLRVNDRGHANEDGLSGFVGADDISDHKGSETGSAQVNGSGQTPLPLADLSPGHGSPESPLEFPSEGLAVETASVPAEPRPTSAACRDHVAGSEALGCFNYDQSQERGQSQPPEDRDTGHPEALELLSHNCPDTGTTRGSDCEERERSQAGVSGRSHVSDRQHSFCTEQVAVEVTLCCGSGPLTDQTSKDCTPHCTPVKSQPPLQSRRRPRLVRVPTMPTLPEEENDSPEEVDSSSSSPTTYTPVESKVVNITLAAPSIILPRPAQSDNLPLDQTRPHSPRPRLSRTSASLGTPITTVDHKGHVIDLVKDQLPELQLSEKDRLKNLELLEEAKKVSDRFLTRRGRRSTCSLSDSPTALSPNLTPCSSPVPSRSSSTSVPPLTAAEVTEPTFPTSLTSLHLEVPSTHEQTDPNKPDQETIRHLEWKPSERRKVSSGTLSPRHTTPSSPHEPAASSCGVLTAVPEKRLKKAASGPEEAPSCWSLGSQASATGVAKPVPRANSQQAPCTAEIKTIGAFPPLMRAVSWDTVGSLAMMNGAQNLSSPQNEDSTFTFPEKARDPPFKSSGYKDFPVPPVNVQKLSKLREEHKLMRNQSISGSKLPDLKETAEQERVQCPPPGSPIDEEAREKADAMPNISDIMLRKLKLHRGLPGCAPPLSEKEVENAFVQLSLAFRNDNYTLETRLRQAERERNLTEENVEKELEEFKGSLKNSEQRETYQRLLETMAVLQRLAVRLSSRAEMVGAVRQEKRMNKATEVMMQYVENLKRTYEKDHAELMEFKKLANQNSNRCYGGSVDTGDDGVPRASRSMSLTMGKALPRRRVSVAVVPKFNLLNIPGQTPATASPAQPPITSPGPPLPVLCETTVKSLDPVIPAVAETGKAVAEQEREEAVAEKPQSSVEEIKAELKAKIEEEAFNKGYQEGLKRSKEVQEVKEQEDKVEEEHVELEKRDEETDKETKSGRYGELLEILDRICPKIFRRSRLLWTSLTFFLTMFLLFNLVSYFSDYSNHGDAPAEKTMSPGKNKLFGLDVGLQAKNPTTE
ncbi:protein MRVI1 isoform X2 [Denticeps clupeoides]|uniref:protein MRVI1 isoform X2 n=1 Tax=Denticeps clupeoides TaxID=299321 RepID=UPI0010A4FCA6|nr:protein MRVI1 isoform X2 [Denticeps clupeoides]